MAKLFVFGIGGTGSRVIRSLVMLMAAGVKIKNCDKIVPIIIDPDTQNGDMNRTVELLKTYKHLHDQLGKRDEGFFHTNISTLSSIAGDGSSKVRDSFVYDFGGINKPFKDHVGYNQLDIDSQALVDLLFTPENLNNSLDVGFRGSPNVGSVVLNEIIDSPEMRFFASNFQAGDRIFFVSSIFGGTGAAGFPLLLKNFKDSRSSLPNASSLNAALTGAMVVLPYFSLEQPAAGAEVDFIDSNTFTTKAKDALSYYQHHLQGVNATYYMGDTPDKPLENNPGRASQKNDAHLVELLSALSIIDFMDYSDNELSGSALFHEFGLREDVDNVQFSHLDQETRDRIAKQLIRFHFFSRYFTHHVPEDSQAAYAKGVDLAGAMRNEPIFRELTKFLNSPDFGYEAWLKELGRMERTFSAFHLNEPDFNRMVSDKQVETGFLNKGISQGAFVKELNRASEAISDREAFKATIKAFEVATNNLVEEKLKYS
ncbi:hypothetical protein [Rufibacter ruber]|uniref:hypothetical protein n=1 Tax=Rufibacter ruber TaxID=1783499 RepID=UPI000834DDE9|nr:hypothetical protein [Rufibacter ruber]